MGPRAKKFEIAYSHCSFSWAEFTGFITSQNRREGLIWEVENKIQTHTHTHRERNKLTWSCSGWEKKNPSNRSMCVSFLGVRGHENGSGTPPDTHTHTPSSLHMCGYLFETFPPVLASCSTFYLLVCSPVSHKTTRVRGAQPCGAAQIVLFFFFFFDTWQIINGGLGRLETEQRAKTHRLRCLTAQVRADKNLLLAVFLWGSSISHQRMWIWLLSRVFCRGLG